MSISSRWSQRCLHEEQDGVRVSVRLQSPFLMWPHGGNKPSPHTWFRATIPPHAGSVSHRSDRWIIMKYAKRSLTTPLRPRAPTPGAAGRWGDFLPKHDHESLEAVCRVWTAGVKHQSQRSAEETQDYGSLIGRLQREPGSDPEESRC